MMNERKTYTFLVHGFLPPKKGMDLSMFGKSSEADKIVALRKSALEAMCGEPPLRYDISMSIVVHIGPTNDRMTGDLDNFITGVCDGLMAAAPNAKIAPVFNRPELVDIYPSKAICFLDDSAVVNISAQKIIGDTRIPWYEVVLGGF